MIMAILLGNSWDMMLHLLHMPSYFLDEDIFYRHMTKINPLHFLNDTMPSKNTCMRTHFIFVSLETKNASIVHCLEWYDEHQITKIAWNMSQFFNNFR